MWDIFMTSFNNSVTFEFMIFKLEEMAKLLGHLDRPGHGVLSLVLVYTFQSLYKYLFGAGSANITDSSVGLKRRLLVLYYFVRSPASLLLFFQSSRSSWKDCPSPSPLSFATTNCPWNQTEKMAVIRCGPAPCFKTLSGWITSFPTSFLTSPNFWTHY